MSVQAFKLISGEDVITDVVKEDAATITVKSPAVIVIQQNGNGQMGVGLQPFAPLADGDVTLFKTALSASFEVEVNIKNEYSRIFGSGIVIANQMPGMSA